ncbi:MAG: ParM/StbA family protein [Eubacteriales bacterium]|nr:ParM/StbA family protein [Eubacteriales bacterium]
MLFPIDHGNSQMKTTNFVFSSGLADYPIRPPVDTEVLEYGGKFWTLSGQRISYMRDKTKDDRYFILTLFAIAKELQHSNSLSPMVETDLAVGLPPEHYALRQRFADYFKRGAVNFVFNGMPICLMIRHVMVYPQAYAAVVPQSHLLKEVPRTFIIDIGGFTTDVMLLRRTEPDMQFCRSLEMGVIPMSNDIIGRVSALYDMKIEDDHIADIIQGRNTILPQEVREAVFTTVRDYAYGILDKLRELQVDLRANPAIFIGGGSILFKSFLEESPLVAKADFVLDPKANAIGYGMLATAQLRRMMPQNNGGEIFAQG